jgi:SAM-dependent methyltransferase
MSMSKMQSVFDESKIEPVTRNRMRLIRAQQFIRRILSPIGLDVKVDLSYHGNYLINVEDPVTRFNQESGKRDAEVISGYVAPDSVVLDIGCSVGRVEKFLAPLVGEVYGVDISPRAIALGRKYVSEHPNVHLYANNGRDLSLFKNDKFDFSFSLATFLHMSVEDTLCYLIESFRCLKPGGRVLFQFQSLKLMFDQFAYRAVIGDRTEIRPRHYTPDQLGIFFERVGFEVECIYEGNFKVDPECIWMLAAKPMGER